MNNRRKHGQCRIFKSAASQRRLKSIVKNVIARPYLGDPFKMGDRTDRRRRTDAYRRHPDPCVPKSARKLSHYVTLMSGNYEDLVFGFYIVRMPGVGKNPGKIQVCGVSDQSRDLDRINCVRFDTNPVSPAVDL